MPPPSRADLWSSGKDETVEVNQRALIDKILARYSGEFTIFRELLQNADDAGAEHVQVRFFTQAGIDAQDRGEGPSKLPDVRKDPMVRYVITNDGIPFRPEDWQRLKKIAEGNPDEEKIGAFGVGFYSLWSVCDDPFVESGGRWMGFYWKDGKDQLLARSGDLPPEASASAAEADRTSTGHPWTSFSMNLREPTVLEAPLDLARFFITSLTFMRTLKKIDMVVDGVKVLEVQRSLKGKERVTKKGLKTTSSNGMMTVMGVDRTGMVIMVKVMKWLSSTGFTPPPLPPATIASAQVKTFTSFFSSSFFSRTSASPAPVEPPTPPPPPEDPFETTLLHRDIEVYQADIKVTVSPSFGKELERATKKSPPTRMPASLVYSRENDEEAVVDSGDAKAAKDVGGVFAGLCPPLDGEKSAKVFIGQATSQTTGIGGHLAARFIPTVERESIDLVDRHVSHWNRELLWVGGYLSRLIYELEMINLQDQWKRISASDPDARARILARGLHALRFFSFKPTTPSATVGQEMESAFFLSSSDNKALPLISSAGILPVGQIRQRNTEMEAFLPDLPTLTTDTEDRAPRFMARLHERNLLRQVTLDDVVEQFRNRPLTEDEMTAALRWWQSIASSPQYTSGVRDRLLNAAVLVMADGKIIQLSQIRTYVRPQSSFIPTDMPLPAHTLPYALTKDLKGGTVSSAFGWSELSLPEYIAFLADTSALPSAHPETSIRTSPVFAEKVLALLGRAWQSISAEHQAGIKAVLKDVPCIPTKAGFKVPGEAYFEKNLLFEDLPTIALPNTKQIKGNMEKMLLGLGVRRTVDLQLVFSRLVGGGTWSCHDLMKYLVSVKDSLSSEEVARLRQTAAFPLEQPKMEDGSQLPIVRKKPHQLYEPTDALRALGLPLLDWGENKWKPNTEEAKMLYNLGLKRSPPIDVLLGIAAGRPPTNERALQYLLQNHSTHYSAFDPSAFSGVAFIPATAPDGTRILAKPGSVFTNWSCAMLGFAVADAAAITPEAATKLRIQTDPPMSDLVRALLATPVKDIDKARQIFEAGSTSIRLLFEADQRQYLGTRLASGGSTALQSLQTAAFVPVKTEKEVRLHRPVDVYFANKDETDSLFRSVFTFIDFGDKANVFLRYCGVKSEPSVKDIAMLLMREPQKMLDQAGSAEKYLEQLRLLAANWTNFDISTRSAMRSAPFLLASQRVPVARQQSKKLLSGLNSSAAAEEEYEREWVMCRATDVAVVDNITMLQYFGRSILAAPEEQLLEDFYAHLGAKPLTSLVKVDHIHSGALQRTSSQSQVLRQHVLERLTIFLAETRRRSAEYSAEWLMKDGNFVIEEVRDLKARFTLKYGARAQSHLEVMYATAAKRSRAIVLTVSVTAEPDDYDIASALCQVLLKTPRADDTLLLYSILTTPLLALRKRGINVDRILNQQREERLRVQAEAVRDREKAAAESKARIASGTPRAPDLLTGDDTESIYSTATDSHAGTNPPGSEKSAGGVMDALGEKKSKSLFDRLKRASGAKPAGQSGGGLAETLAEMSRSAGIRGPGIGGGMGASGGVGGGAGGGGSGVASTPRPTDMSQIRSTVQKAIDASRPEAGTQISESRQAVADVSESQNAYCDVSAGADLILAVPGSAEMLGLWIPRGTTDPSAYVKERMTICERFGREILIPIAKVFKLSMPVLNIFWDEEGPLIAFNRGGTIFCNARYYLAWHNAQVEQGNTSEAFISWYFSIAHELAHNLESAHNASHEFYFSSIAEEFLRRFIPLLH